MTGALRGPVGLRDHVLGAAIACAYVALLLGTTEGLGMSRDETFYVTAAERYGAWFGQLVDDPSAATTQAAIDRYWSYNHEHPALAKSAFALSLLAHRKWDIFATESTAIRFPGMVSGGLLLWLLYIFGARVYGRGVGLFAAAAHALLPRFFYHAHLDCFDVPITLAILAVVYCYWRSLERPWWALWAGLAFGAALATKHNSWIVPGVLLIHWVWTARGGFLARQAGLPARVSRVPWWLIAFVTVGPLVFLVSWPWIWNDTLERLRAYASFHLQHVHYTTAYFGTSYFRPPFPVSYPWVLTAYTVTLTTLALAMAGVALRARAFMPPRLRMHVLGHGAGSGDRTYADVLMLGCLLAPMVVIALPSTPIFGGTKHWMPAYPFMALFAGLGCERVVRELQQWLRIWWPGLASLAGPVAGLVLLAPAVVDTAHSHQFGLSHYTFLAGGAPGAADDGMNRQFWGFTQGHLGAWFLAEAPDGGTVWLCDATAQSWQMLQREGVIPTNVRATSNLSTADFALVHHEDHFAEVDFQIWTAFGTVQPAHVLTYDGVPIISVYRNPHTQRQGAPGTQRAPVR